MTNSVIVRLFLCVLIYSVGCICVYGFNRSASDPERSWMDLFTTAAGVVGCGVMFCVLCFTDVL